MAPAWEPVLDGLAGLEPDPTGSSTGPAGPEVGRPALEPDRVAILLLPRDAKPQIPRFWHLELP
jgi:hypothetical protein